MKYLFIGLGYTFDLLFYSSLGLIFYVFISLMVILSFLWDFNFRRAMQMYSIRFWTQQEKVGVGEQYWYYQSPWHCLLKIKQWEIRKAGKSPDTFF
ncbi:hypothetical protein LZG71_02380 [Dyadobacter sp. CY312]|nr:hypothetical protein [Dyadobacter sp. CY312]